MNLSEELKWRGFINQTTLKDISDLDNWEDKKFYNGYDASADSLTIGNLATVMLNKVFARHGWEPVILAGGATSLIGDPGGKDKERPMQSVEDITRNVSAVAEQLTKLFGSEVKTVNNLDWFKDMNVLDFLRDVGKHFSMTPLVQRDYIAKRIGEGGSGISYTEFSYTLLQGYDFLKLHGDGVSLQLAGSDQWGNCLSGVDLVRRVTGHEVHAITMPLIVDKTTGKKFGKSEAGAVWLDSKRTSESDFFQFWINLDDEGVEDYLKIYTELSKDQIDEVLEKFNNDRSKRHAQSTLAYEVTKLVHGSNEAEKLLDAFRNVKSKTISLASQYEVAQNVHDIETNMSVIDALVGSGLAGSKTEARQLLKAGGVYLNDNKFDSDTFNENDFNDQGLLSLRRGKTLKNTVVIKRKVS